MIFSGLTQAVFGVGKTGINVLSNRGTSMAMLTFSRTLMKTHKGAAKRWIKTGNGYKRGKVGRKHGNAGWSQRLLQHKDGKTMALGKGHGDMKKKLKRLLPYW